MSGTIENLDFQCAAFGEAMAQKADETTVGNTLGVLQEDGVYACLLYLLSQTGKKQGARDAFDWLLKLLISVKCPIKLPEGKGVCDLTPNQLPATVDSLENNLDQLLFAKQVMERALIYARYHVKAKPAAPKKGAK